MTDFKQKYGFTKEEWEICLNVLDKLKDSPLDNPSNQAFASLITKIHKNAKKELKQRGQKEQKVSDVALLKQAKIAEQALNRTTSFDHKEGEQPFYTDFKKPKNCYCCNGLYGKMHSFYHRLCPDCATLNYSYRGISLALENRNVILTGGRVKVGYATALKFLRSKANLIITTRFPALALEQFKQEVDYTDWQSRLTIYGLDLRNLKAVEEFIHFYKSQYNTLDVLVNNAAQTIQYPSDYYQPLMDKEQQLLIDGITNKQLIANATPIGQTHQVLDSFKENEQPVSLNRFGQPVDFRTKNSWNARLEEISTYELLEVNLINHISPYLMIKALTPLLKKSSFKEKFIVNVTSSEGQFSYGNKTIYHPHTNMTKAALNMLTLTAAMDYAKDQIYMNSVDVGWVSTGADEAKRKAQFEVGYIPPLDPVDAAARILHPIHEALINQKYIAGKLLKHFEVVNW